jgi:dynein heavy chain
MIRIVGTDLEKLQRIAMGALIVIDVHAKEVISRMIKSKVDNVNDFDWTC